MFCQLSWLLLKFAISKWDTLCVYNYIVLSWDWLEGTTIPMAWRCPVPEIQITFSNHKGERQRQYQYQGGGGYGRDRYRWYNETFIKRPLGYMVSQDRWSFTTGRINMILYGLCQINCKIYVFLVRPGFTIHVPLYFWKHRNIPLLVVLYVFCFMYNRCQFSLSKDLPWSPTRGISQHRPRTRWSEPCFRLL